MIQNTQWNIKLRVISILVLCSMMFFTIQPALADDCLLEHLAVIAARAALELAEANRDAAQHAVDTAEGFLELAAALAWLASAEIALNLAEAAHDDAVQALNECLNPPCPCGCGVDGCDTCEEHASGGCDPNSCSGGCDSGASSGYYE